MSFRFPWHFLPLCRISMRRLPRERGKKSFVGVVDGAEIEESSSLPDIESGDQWVSFLPFLRDEAWDSQIRSTSLLSRHLLRQISLFRSCHLIPAASSRHFCSPVEGERGENSQLLFLLPPLVCRKNSDDLQFNLGCGEGRGGGGIGNSSQFPIPRRDFSHLPRK